MQNYKCYYVDYEIDSYHSTSHSSLSAVTPLVLSIGTIDTSLSSASHLLTTKATEPLPPYTSKEALPLYSTASDTSAYQDEAYSVSISPWILKVVMGGLGLLLMYCGRSFYGNSEEHPLAVCSVIFGWFLVVRAVTSEKETEEKEVSY